MQNIEIKARIQDLDAAAQRAQALGARWVWTRRQVDVFFRVAHGYLKLRTMEGAPAELIAYSREEGTHPRASDYVIAPVSDPALLSEALSHGLGVLGTVEKTRTLYQWRHTRIHLDRVTDLGDYLELETVLEGIDRKAGEAESLAAIAGLALDPKTFEAVPYLVLLRDARLGCAGR